KQLLRCQNQHRRIQPAPAHASRHPPPPLLARPPRPTTTQPNHAANLAQRRQTTMKRLYRRTPPRERPEMSEFRERIQSIANNFYRANPKIYQLHFEITMELVQHIQTLEG